MEPTQIEAGQTPQEVAVEALSPQEQKRREEVLKVRRVLEDAKQAAQDQALQDFAGIVRDATKTEEPEPEVKRQPIDVGVIKSERVSLGARVTADSRDILYSRMSTERRQWRNPESDEICARWIRAAMRNDFRTIHELQLLHREYFVEDISRAPLDLDLPTGDPLVPVPLANVIVLDRQDASVLRPLVRKWTSANSSLRIPLSSIAVGEITAEKNPSGNPGASGPTPRELLLTKVKKRWEATATEEFIADSPFNVVSWFTEAVAEAFGALEDSEICTSTGGALEFTSSIVQGVPTVTQDGVGFAYIDVVAVHHAVPKPYRGRGVWLVDNATLVALDSLVGTDGHPVFRAGSNMPSVRGDAGGSPAPDGWIFNKAVYEVPLAANTLWFGDAMQYHMLDSPGISMRADASVNFNTDEIAFKAIERVDGGIGNANAARVMTITP